MATTCEQIGHYWQPTTAPGWFWCARVAKHTKNGTPLSCNMVAVCPGCLGYAITGAQNLLCVAHSQICTLADFPVVEVESLSNDASTVDSLFYEQTSLW